MTAAYYLKCWTLTIAGGILAGAIAAKVGDSRPLKNAAVEYDKASF